MAHTLYLQIITEPALILAWEDIRPQFEEILCIKQKDDYRETRDLRLNFIYEHARGVLGSNKEKEYIFSFAVFLRLRAITGLLNMDESDRRVVEELAIEFGTRKKQ